MAGVTVEREKQKNSGSDVPVQQVGRCGNENEKQETSTMHDAKVGSHRRGNCQLGKRC